MITHCYVSGKAKNPCHWMSGRLFLLDKPWQRPCLLLNHPCRLLAVLGRETKYVPAASLNQDKTLTRDDNFLLARA